MVTLVHPKLPDREITVNERQAKVLIDRSGWKKKTERRSTRTDESKTAE